MDFFGSSFQIRIVHCTLCALINRSYQPDGIGSIFLTSRGHVTKLCLNRDRRWRRMSGAAGGEGNGKGKLGLHIRIYRLKMWLWLTCERKSQLLSFEGTSLNQLMQCELCGSLWIDRAQDIIDVSSVARNAALYLTTQSYFKAKYFDFWTESGDDSVRNRLDAFRAFDGVAQTKRMLWSLRCNKSDFLNLGWLGLTTKADNSGLAEFFQLICTFEWETCFCCSYNSNTRSRASFDCQADRSLLHSKQEFRCFVNQI